MLKNNIISPCISICKTDPISGFCYGCGRTAEDKRMWADPNTTNSWKESNLFLTTSRLSGWQQDAWNKSYEHKKKTGISLIKEKALKQKK